MRIATGSDMHTLEKLRLESRNFKLFCVAVPSYYLISSCPAGLGQIDCADNSNKCGMLCVSHISSRFGGSKPFTHRLTWRLFPEAPKLLLTEEHIPHPPSFLLEMAWNTFCMELLSLGSTLAPLRKITTQRPESTTVLPALRYLGTVELNYTAL